MKTLAIILALLSVAATVRFTWDPNNESDQVQLYYISSAPSVFGPWAIIGSTAGTNFTHEMNAAHAFFHVKASNFWGLSEPSNVITTPPPAKMPGGMKIERKP